jgi:RNA polymerase sigma-70 factor, ECF subfamily
VNSQPVVPDPATSVSGVLIVRMLNPSENDVIEQLQRGAADALVILFDRYYRLVLKVALRILRDRGEAEDLMQDVFLEIFNKAGQFDPARGSAKTWILQYAYHRSLNRRQYLALRNFYQRQQITENEVCEPRSRDLSWRGLTPEEWRPVLERGLAGLNEKQRKTLELACFEGLLLSEIAERTKESVANVRHHYYRGLESLRKSLQAGHPSEEEPRKSGQEANDDEE